MRDHESEIILFETAVRELKRLGAVPLPTTESIKAKLAALNTKKEKLLAEYKMARNEAQEYETIKKECGYAAVRPEGENKGDSKYFVKKFVPSACHLL